jgi:hypothetical protein
MSLRIAVISLLGKRFVVNKVESFVSIVLTILGGIIGGTYAFYGLLAVTSVFTAIFMVKRELKRLVIV